MDNREGPVIFMLNKCLLNAERVKYLHVVSILALTVLSISCQLIISRDSSIQNWIQTDEVEVKEIKNVVEKPEGVLDESECDVPPLPKVFDTPVYPERLQRAGIEGSVNFAVIIDTLGFVKKFSVIYATDSLFAESVESASRRWRFKPAIADEKPVKCFKKHYFNFRLGH